VGYRSERTKDDSSGIPDSEMYEPWKMGQQALNRYEAAETVAIEDGRDPQQDPEVRRSLSVLHTSVMSAFRRLSPYLEGTQYWDESPLDEQAGLVGLQELEKRQMSYREQVVERETRHQGTQQEVVRQMNYLTVTAYSRALNLMGQRLRECGFAPQAMIQDFDDPEVLR